MIYLTKINGEPLVLNSDLIEQVTATPDTLITITSGHQYMVTESPQEVVRRTVEYHRSIYTPGQPAFAQNWPAGPNRNQLTLPYGEAQHGCQ